VKYFQSKGKKPKEIKIKDDAKQERVRDEIKRGASGWGENLHEPGNLSNTAHNRTVQSATCFEMRENISREECETEGTVDATKQSIC